MSLASSEIVSMQNQSAYNQADSMLNGTSQTSSTDDSNMFLTLMLQQLQNQDPTQPTDNTEWLAQLAQYSTLEQMTEMNQGLDDCMSYLSALYSDLAANAEITQTLSLIGKEVTINYTDPETEEEKEITGIVTEASFEEGSGKVKVGDEYYSIANIVSIRESENSPDTSNLTVTASAAGNGESIKDAVTDALKSKLGIDNKK